MEWKLTSTNLCSCNNLTWIPKEIIQELRKGEWESSLDCGHFWSKWATERSEWGCIGVFMLPSQKTSRWLKGTWILRVYVWILRTLGSGHSGLRAIYRRGAFTQRLRVYVWTLRTSLSGPCGLGPGHSGFSREFHKKTIFSGRFDSPDFCRFSWAQLPRQHL
jgi:hypothetical protein